MKEQGKITAGILIFVGLIVWCLAPVFAQTTTYKFHPDGTMTSEYDGQGGYSIERFDKQMRILEQSHYFPGGVRMKMFSKFRYENDMLAEEISYNYAQGYERETYQYNEFGYHTENRSYTSQTEGNWKEVGYLIQAYDERNNRIYFRSKYTGYSQLINRMTRSTYDYANRTRSDIDYEFDANDREISAVRGSKVDIGDRSYEREGKFVFDVNKHSANMRDNRFVSWSGYDEKGNRQDRFFMNDNTITRSFDQNSRMIQLKIGRPAYDGSDKPLYQYDEIVDFRYDDQGRLIESLSDYFSELKIKKTYTHGRNIVEKQYRQTPNGGWKLISTKNYDSIDLFTPRKNVGFAQSAAASVQQQSSGPIASGVSQNPPSQSSIPNTAIPNPMSGSLVNDLNELNIESNESESLSAYALDAEKLAHIADVLSHTTGVKVTEEQVLALAMQLLIEQYNADLREMNTAYLRDKVSVFD